jgi:glycosyltransferase involved in cell wall biosynthesis
MMKLNLNTGAGVKVLHVITDLNGYGGTEATLFKYLEASSIPKYNHLIIVLKTIGVDNTIGRRIVNAGFDVVELRISSSMELCKSFSQLITLINKYEPDVISAWLYHPILIVMCSLVCLHQKPAVIWHIRCDTPSPLMRPDLYLIQKVLGLISNFYRPIVVSNSKRALSNHVKSGFKVIKSDYNVVQNGVNVLKFYPDYSKYTEIRETLAIQPHEILIGVVARFAPEKGYATFFEAVHILQKKLSNEIFKRLHFMCLGAGASYSNNEFTKLISTSHDLQNNLHLLDKQPDVEYYMRAMDIFVLPSKTESFPNVLIEAMATTLPCICTNVGQCADILNQPEYIVPPNDPIKLADVITCLIKAGKEARYEVGRRNRDRAVSLYSVDRMVIAFDSLFNSHTLER